MVSYVREKEILQEWLDQTKNDKNNPDLPPGFRFQEEPLLIYLCAR